MNSGFLVIEASWCVAVCVAALGVSADTVPCPVSTPQAGSLNTALFLCHPSVPSDPQDFPSSSPALYFTFWGSVLSYAGFSACHLMLSICPPVFTLGCWDQRRNEPMFLNKEAFPEQMSPLVPPGASPKGLQHLALCLDVAWK